MYKSIFLFFILLAARLTQLVQLYFTSIPSGGLLTEQPIKSFICASIVEISTFAIIAFLFSIVFLIKQKKWHSFFYAFFASIGVIYLLFSAINDQVMRWMGQHFDLAFIKTYSVSNLEPKLFLNIASNGIVSFIISSLIVLITAWLLYFIPKKITFKNHSYFSLGLSSIVLFALFIISFTAIDYINLSVFAGNKSNRL